MSRTEHLQRILTKLDELLATAEKRTPGEWEHGFYLGEPVMCIRTAERQPTYLFDAIGCRPSVVGDAAFIASCAGRAEAGWRATKAAIEEATRSLAINAADLDPEHHLAARFLDAIIAAWPEDLV